MYTVRINSLNVVIKLFVIEFIVDCYSYHKNTPNFYANYLNLIHMRQESSKFTIFEWDPSTENGL